MLHMTERCLTCNWKAHIRWDHLGFCLVAESKAGFALFPVAYTEHIARGRQTLHDLQTMAYLINQPPN